MSDTVGVKVITAYTGNAAFNALWQKRMGEATDSGLSFLLAEDFIDWVLSETWKRFNDADSGLPVCGIKVTVIEAIEWLKKWKPA